MHHCVDSLAPSRPAGLTGRLNVLGTTALFCLNLPVFRRRRRRGGPGGPGRTEAGRRAGAGPEADSDRPGSGLLCPGQ
jgi:hypothetical protein